MPTPTPYRVSAMPNMMAGAPNDSDSEGGEETSRARRPSRVQSEIPHEGYPANMLSSNVKNQHTHILLSFSVFLHQCLVVIFKLSLLLFSVYGCGYRSTRVLAVFAALRNPKGLLSTPVSTSFSRSRIPPAVIRPAILDRATAALAPPPPIRAFPVVAPKSNATDNDSQPTRSTRRRQPHALRR